MSIISITVIALNLALGLIVFLRKPNNMINIFFLGIVISISLWAASTYLLALQSVSLSVNQFFNSLAYASAFLAIYFGVLLTTYYPVSRKRSFLFNYVLYVVSGIVFVLSFTPLVTGSVTRQNNINEYTFGYLLPIYALTLLVYLLIIISNLLNSYKTGNKTEKDQSKILMAAFGVPILIGLISNLLIPFIASDWASAQYGPMLSVFLVGLVAYAIVRHSLFDIRRVVARVVAYGLSLIITTLIYSGVAFIIISSLLKINVTRSELLLFALTSSVIALLFLPIKHYFDKISDRIFYQDRYDPQQIINEINAILVNKNKLEDIVVAVSETIESRLKIEFVTFYIDAMGDGYHLPAVFNNNKQGYQEHIIKLLQGSELKIINIDNRYIDNKSLSILKRSKVDCLAKLIVNGDKVGHMAVGARKSGVSFGDKDLQLIEIIADEVAIAVQNAMRYDEISKFNLTLQKRVDTATHQLQNSNDKLQKLDEAKDEFISMASHQLRTPLTSVKGYVSMVLEGDAGEINEQQRIFLNQALVSSQRMVYLIADLLNVSRLKTGKFLIETRPTYLPDVVESEVSQLYETAQGRGLTLKFTKPKTFPTISLDETKIRQVIMNFVDNAIYYTPKGGKITVGLKANPKSIEFTVADTGIGVSKQDQHKLFNKFYRAGNARKARPDGTGLGLYMAKKVVVAQGGAIIFETKENQGSVFGFTFPIPASPTEKQ